MSEELKPCPFCGKVPTEDTFTEPTGYPIGCECIWETHTVPKCQEKWNTRPLEDALRKQLEIAKEALFFYATHLIEGGKVASEALAEIEKLKS